MLKRVVGGGRHQRPEVLGDAPGRCPRRRSPSMNLPSIVAIRSRFFLPTALRRSSASAGAEAGHLLGDLHQLLLVDAAAVGRLGDRAQALVGVADRAPGRACRARSRGCKRIAPGPVERDERDDVVELGRADLAQRLAHALGLELEDADRVAAGEHLVGRRRRRAGSPRSRSRPRASARMISTASSITSRLRRPRKSIFSSPISSIGPIEYWVTILYWRAGLARSSPVLAPAPPRSSASCSGTISSSGRSAITTAAAWIELLRTIPSRPWATSTICFVSRVGVVGLAQLLARLQALLEARAAAHDRLRDQLREAVAGRVVVAEHAGGVAGRRARRHLAEGDDLGDRLAPVLLLHVADHALAAADREVDVDVRHRLARRVEEALEQQVVGERVEVGDVERVGDDRAGGRAAARADGDPVLLRVADEVPDDQEVGVEAHLGDHAELELERARRASAGSGSP